jgi:VanZ family protein
MQPAPMMISRPFRILVFVLACLAVVWGSLTPTSALPGVTLWDKFEHAGAYLVLSVLGAAAFPFRFRRLAAGLFLGGVGVEVAQSLMGLGRQGDPVDALANTVGIALGLGLALAARRIFNPRP